MTSMLTARVDSEKRKIAEKVFSEIGLSTSAAIKLYICAVAMNGGIPFPVGVNVHARGTFQRLQDRHERQNGIRLGLADGRYKLSENFDETFDALDGEIAEMFS